MFNIMPNIIYNHSQRTIILLYSTVIIARIYSLSSYYMYREQKERKFVKWERNEKGRIEELQGREGGEDFNSQQDAIRPGTILLFSNEKEEFL